MILPCQVSELGRGGLGMFWGGEKQKTRGKQYRGGAVRVSSPSRQLKVPVTIWAGGTGKEKKLKRGRGSVNFTENMGKQGARGPLGGAPRRKFNKRK